MGIENWGLRIEVWGLRSQAREGGGSAARGKFGVASVGVRRAVLLRVGAYAGVGITGLGLIVYPGQPGNQVEGLIFGIKFISVLKCNSSDPDIICRNGCGGFF